MFGAGLALVGLPLVVSQQPAGAGTDTKTRALTFQAFSGQAVTCSLTNSSNHDTGEPDAPFATVFASVSGGSNCSGLMTIVIAFKDKQGVGRRMEAGSSPDFVLHLSAYVEGAYTAVNTHADITFANCDPDHSATCELSVPTSPK
jgi:hypothetical protein